MKKEYFCVGTYTDPILFGTGELYVGNGEGIYLCTLESNAVQVIQQIALSNPSYLCIDEQYKKIYAVNELKEFEGRRGGGITQIGYEDGTLKWEADLPTDGIDPCHVEMDPKRNFLSVANFGSGSISIFPLDENGNLTGERRLFEHNGSSIHPIRQKRPHAHGTVFWKKGARMLVPDLGIDLVKVYSYQKDFVCPVSQEDIRVAPGSGPRFGAFDQSEKNFYLINELASNIMHFSYDGTEWQLKETFNTLPDGFPSDQNICSDLHITPNGQFLYASNRGHDSICCYRIEENGSLTLLERVSSGGKTPRNFAISPSGTWLVAGNQDSDNLAIFQIERDGKLTLKFQVDFPSPVCIRFFLEQWEKE